MKATTKTAQFTPGPWVVNTFVDNGQRKLEVLDATGANACVQANANLIAAAPAMYAALKDALACIEQTLSRKEINERRDRINAALAQAEGK